MLKNDRILKAMIFISLFSIHSCIEEYKPVIDSNDSDAYVIEGNITDQGGFYSIFVSKASSIENARFTPVKECTVRVFDDNDNTFEAQEHTNGEYKVYIDKNFLSTGTAFKVEVTTPNEEIISSTYDTLRSSPEVDTVYYSIEELGTTNPEYNMPIINFYMNYDGQNSNSRNIKIEIEETWKYTAPYPKRWTWDGDELTEFDPPDYSLSTCWNTIKDPYIYSFSTQNFSDNKYSGFALHTIHNTSMKLLEGYSLLVKQLSISDAAYSYYKKIQANAMTEGGLYESQPEQIKSNLYNMTNPDARVLGYFYVASVQSKRIYYGPFENIELNTTVYCEPIEIGLSLELLRDPPQPLYIWFENGSYYTLPDACVDCTSQGGTTIKPDFWPN